MGINSKAYLPNDINADDIVQAIAYLCGAERTKEELRGDGYRSWYAGFNRKEVTTEPNLKNIKLEHGIRVFVEPTHSMQFFTIYIAPTNCDNTWHHGSLFLYPQSDHPNRILLYAGVSEFWHKIDRALVDFFGGEVDDNDCDEVDVDYQKRKPRKNNYPNDGKPWQKFQEDMMNLPVLFQFTDEGELE